jgi:hypothetical protein
LIRVANVHRYRAPSRGNHHRTKEQELPCQRNREDQGKRCESETTAAPSSAVSAHTVHCRQLEFPV